MRIRFHETELRRIAESDEVIEELRRHAGKVAGAASAIAPSHLEFSTRAGRAGRGVFAQAIMQGRAAVAIEFGSKNNAPYAPLRKALARRR